MEIKPISVAKISQLKKPGVTPAPKKPAKFDLSCEEKGFYKFGDRIVDIIFPR